MKKEVIICLCTIFLLGGNYAFANNEPNSIESIIIYYDDFDIIYRVGGTIENIIERADYIIEAKRPQILIKIPHEKTFPEQKDVSSIDVRLRFDFKFSNGEIITYCFGNSTHWMQINHKFFLCDRAFLNYLLPFLPIKEKDKIYKWYKLTAAN